MQTSLLQWTSVWRHSVLESDTISVSCISNYEQTNVKCRCCVKSVRRPNNINCYDALPQWHSRNTSRFRSNYSVISINHLLKKYSIITSHKLQILDSKSSASYKGFENTVSVTLDRFCEIKISNSLEDHRHVLTVFKIPLPDCTYKHVMFEK
jgi:hypothetical protein